MSKESFEGGQEDIRDLLEMYNSMREGAASGALTEDSFERIIDHYDDMDDLKSAIEAAETGMEQHPYSGALIVKKADLLIALRRYQEALRLLDKAEILDSTDIDIYILRTDAYLALDQQEKAVHILKEAIERFTGEDRLNLLFELADVYDDYEEFDKIFDCLRMVLETEPTNEEALYKICFWTDFTGRNEESIELHMWVIDQHPYSELAWFNLAAAYQGLKLFEKAIDAYKYAIVINEKFDYAYRNMADACIRIRKYKDAIEALEKVVELARPEDVIYEAIGHCHERLGNHAQARFNYRKASHLNPEDAKLVHKIAVTYLREKNWVQAVKYMEMALRSNRRNHEFNMAMGEARLHLGQHREAVAHFSQAVTSRPRSLTVREALLRCLFACGMHQEGDRQCRIALKSLGDKPALHFYRVLMLFAMDKENEALLQLENALERSPRFPKRILELYPGLSRRPKVAALLDRYKPSRKR
jgi:tetratricopeptide (TPR) repeat protein